jgi:hypothetical protein
MGNRWLWVLGVVVLLLCVAAGLRSCLRDDGDDATSTQASGAHATQPNATASTAAADATAAQLALVARRNEAMASAVSALHAYLAALGGEDRAKADTWWVGGKPPARTGEADLRDLKNLRALRSQNGTPSPLDSDPVPNALEIPIELRASFSDAPQRRYRGWYRLRRAVTGDHWEITSASIDVDR